MLCFAQAVCSEVLKDLAVSPIGFIGFPDTSSSFLFLFFHFVSCIIFIVMFSSLTAALAFGTVAYALPSAVSPATPFGAVYSALNCQ